jgi:hypothetical protein
VLHVAEVAFASRLYSRALLLVGWAALSLVTAAAVTATLPGATPVTAAPGRPAAVGTRAASTSLVVLVALTAPAVLRVLVPPSSAVSLVHAVGAGPPVVSTPVPAPSLSRLPCWSWLQWLPPGGAPRS